MLVGSAALYVSGTCEESGKETPGKLRDGCCRKIEKIKWTASITNEEILRNVDEKKLSCTQ